MNLQTEITEVRSRIGEEYRADDNDSFFRDDQIAEWLRQAEIQLAYDLPDEALFDLTADATQSLVAGTDSYLLSAFSTSLVDMVRPVAVFVEYTITATQRHPAKIVPFEMLQMSTANPSYRPSTSRPMVAFHAGRVFVRPNPAVNSASGLIVSYIGLPARRFKKRRGTLTSVTSTTVFTDNKTTVFGTNYFVGSSLQLISSPQVTVPNSQEERAVSAFNSATGQFTVGVAMSTLPIAGQTYEAGEVSAFSARFHPLIVALAAWQAAKRDHSDIAELQLAEYKQGIERINARPTRVEEIR